jgi:hypothetical protein
MTSLVPDARRSFLAGLDWRIKEVASPSFVLPDFVALALDHAGTPSSLVAADNDDLAAVLMPLSPTRMLIGQVTPEPVGLSTFNAQAAPYCFAFFVSAFASSELEQLAIRIGISATERVEQALHQAVGKLRATPDVPATLAPLAGEGIGWQAAQPCSFELHADCLAEPDAVRLVTVLKQLAHFARRVFDIDPLLRIVVSSIMLAPSRRSTAVRSATTSRRLSHGKA